MAESPRLTAGMMRLAPADAEVTAAELNRMAELALRQATRATPHPSTYEGGDCPVE